MRCLYSANRSRFGATSPFRPALNGIAKAIADAFGPRVEVTDAGLAGVRGIGPLDGESRHARAHAEIGEDPAGPGRLDGEARVRQHHADGHGEGDVLRSQDAGVDGPVADRRLLPDMDPLPLGGGLQGPFRWPEGLGRLPFVARLDAQHADGRAAGLALRIDADPRLQGAGPVEAPLPAARSSARPCRRRRAVPERRPARLAGPARPGCPHINT